MGELLDQLVQARRAGGLGAPPARVERGSPARPRPPRSSAPAPPALSVRIAAFADGMRAMEKCAPSSCPNPKTRSLKP